jgi:sporulation protein YlmC with PRC-barrel domain
MIRASDLIGCELRTQSGQKLGRVHELRANATGDGWELAGLIAGPRGLSDRFRGGGGPDDPSRGGDVIPWESVVALEDGLVIVRDAAHQSPSSSSDSV